MISEPYERIIFMHMALVAGGGLSMAPTSPKTIIIGVTVMKLHFDIGAHLKQHNGNTKEYPWI